MTAVVFDMDGLLLNTEDLYDLVIGRLLNAEGHEFDRETKRAMMGRPAAVALTIMRDTYSLKQTVEELADEIESGLFEVLPRHLSLMPGVAELLDLLDELKMPYSVATSSRRSFAQVALRQAEVLDRFQFLICGGEVEHGKPAPDIYWASARQHGLGSDRLIVFEDSVAGCQSAVAAGATTVVVPGIHNAGQSYHGYALQVEQIDDPRVLALIHDKKQDSSRT